MAEVIGSLYICSVFIVSFSFSRGQSKTMKRKEIQRK
ncbi:hypothetical protein SLEP1_g25642 [Rubroshorea leprosula]|uniref:Uncharacterized protein n=1 Tax=Rubroshorea leprosula TaxID=152421 RepID=A0AAV5JJR2_9ROSI|nr:hypothetical protein SLEP1_g25642 [Rubroshorea leprosula]